MTERAKQRLQALRENPQASSRYREALSVLHELHIFDILRESFLENSMSYLDNRDAMQFHQLLGYKLCIEDLETLINTPEETVNWKAEFGARESLKEQGFTDAEIIKMLGDE